MLRAALSPSRPGSRKAATASAQTEEWGCIPAKSDLPKQVLAEYGLWAAVCGPAVASLCNWQLIGCSG